MDRLEIIILSEINQTRANITYHSDVEQIRCTISSLKKEINSELKTN